MITGKDVHKAFVAAYPYMEPNWDNLKSCSQDGYNKVANELNKLIGDTVTIDAIKCPTCGAMLTDLKGHPCLV